MTTTLPRPPSPTPPTTARSAGRWRSSASAGPSWCCARSSTASAASTTCARHAAIPRQVLTNRLALLVEHGILRKEPYQRAGRAGAPRVPPHPEGLRPLPGAGRRSPTGATATSPTPRARRSSSRTATAASRSTPSSTCERGPRIDDHRDVVTRPGPGAILDSRLEPCCATSAAADARPRGADDVRRRPTWSPSVTIPTDWPRAVDPAHRRGQPRAHRPAARPPSATYGGPFGSRPSRIALPAAPWLSGCRGPDAVGDVEVGPRRLDDGERQRLVPSATVRCAVQPDRLGEGAQHRARRGRAAPAGPR